MQQKTRRKKAYVLAKKGDDELIIKCVSILLIKQYLCMYIAGMLDVGIFTFI